MAAIRLSRRVFSLPFVQFRSMSEGYGSGVGKGGGGGGDIRSAGGAFGKMEAAHEEQYFRQLQAQQIQALKEKHVGIMDHHKQEIAHHEEAIKRHKEALKEHSKTVKALKDQEKTKDEDSD